MVFVIVWVAVRSKTFCHRGHRAHREKQVLAPGFFMLLRAVAWQSFVGWALPTIIHVGQCPTYGLKGGWKQA